MIKTAKLVKNILRIRLGLVSPFSATFQLTNECNLHCAFCMNWANKNNISYIPISDFENAFRNSRVLKNLSFINFTGGEPFLLDNLEEFARIGDKLAKPIFIRFATNGFLTNKIILAVERILRVVKCKIGIRISLDGLQETHDKIRGQEGSFKAAILTASNLVRLREKTRRISINFGYTITKDNYKDVYEAYLISKKIEVGFNCKPYLSSALYNNTQLKYSAASFNEFEKWQIKNQVLRIIKQKQALSFFEDRLFKFFHSLMVRYLYNQQIKMPCYAGYSSFIVYSNGDTCPCLSKRETVSNLRLKDFDSRIKHTKGWNKKQREKQCSCLTACDTFPGIIVSKFPFYLR